MGGEGGLVSDDKDHALHWASLGSDHFELADRAGVYLITDEAGRESEEST